ncbi:nucleotidyl transferase AbiEii/AbiGii toxin family protein [Massilibacteroides vaginae]|uniref:nucleotidyl transferase AbiEii/AbiGii toxin family protein n=1 Tax=Massilibacteroides vaginae TaxID=1673718 RepID=UPI000A1C94E5|nr:nucleotidyl transferase AbiEii/AbiGii toxin family protein [Massilibacteroides vaginae]
MIICRALVAIFSDEFLFERLAFRGGTALHKLYLSPQPRYSEDIDLVQIDSEPIKPTIDRLREVLSFLGEPKVKQKKNNNTLIFRLESSIPPILPIKLKIEINCREHFNILGFEEVNFDMDNLWFSGYCKIKTYKLDELIGTKVRALYERRKGRDLYDLYKALQNPELNTDNVISCFKEYMEWENKNPTYRLYVSNLEDKMKKDEFLGDTKALLRPDETYDAQKAYRIVKERIIDKLATEEELQQEIANKKEGSERKE